MLDEREFARFGPYLIVRTSGAGGMGRIDLALRTTDEDPDVCVLKRMHLTEQLPEQRARFEREARIAARLSHPNIGRTLRVETIEGELCLAQEFIDGSNLARVMRQAGERGLPPASSAHIVREVANALAYAHDLGGLDIVHRDVTPENIMISWAGEVKLIDFGLARSTVDGTVTNLGMIVGRRSYMAPEVWAGEKPDRRADIFALGVVLWELLTVKRLEDLPEARWRDGIPDPTTVRSEASSELAAIAMKALAVAPQERYQSAAEMAEALAAVDCPAKDPSSELATVLAFFFNVDLAQEVVRGEIAEAREALRSEQPSHAGARPPPRRVVGMSVSALALLCLGVWAFRRETPAAAHRPVSTAPAPDTAAVVPSQETPVRTEAVHARPGPSIRIASDAPAPAVPGPATPLARHHEPAPSPGDLLKDANDRFDDGDVRDAIGLARRAAALGGGGPAHALLGHIYMSQGDLDRAERELAHAVRLNPGDTEAADRLADVRRARAEQEP